MMWKCLHVFSDSWLPFNTHHFPSGGRCFSTAREKGKRQRARERVSEREREREREKEREKEREMRNN
jgi:hypothetical protein